MSFIPVLQPPLDPEIHKGAWAKYDRSTGESMPLHRHLDDTAFVANLLWDSWLPPHSKDVITQAFDGDLILAKKLAVFLAGGHDIGKHSSPFAQKVPELKERMLSKGAIFPTSITPNERKAAPHGLMSALSLKEWFDNNAEAHTKPRIVNSLAMIVGGHHGSYPSLSDFHNNFVFGIERSTHWHDGRLAFWDRAAATAQLSLDDIKKIGTTMLPQPAQIITCGFVIVCDWIASNKDLFPLIDESDSPARAQRALHILGFPRPWHPTPITDDAELFSSSFGLPAGTAPRPVQREAMAIAHSVSTPSLIIIEAPTGEGKTEAALNAAEILASRFNASGVSLALPTCATADAMFPRLIEWLRHRLPDGSDANTLLCHGKAQFNETYQSLFRNASGDFGTIFDDDEANISRNGLPSISIQPHWWFNGRKTAALSDFNVGTIDQFLFSALRSKHVVLRHLGISSKVVILDEIHAADAYMNVYLDRALEWCGAARVPVIALSATLDPTRRQQLLEAYHRGRTKIQKQKPKIDVSAALKQTGYPLISVVNDHECRFVELSPSGRSNNFHVRYLGNSTDDMIGTIVDLSRHGGCIGVVCNTVNRAQEVYERVKDEIADDAEIVLLHSRFVGFERSRIEKSIVSRLGKNSPDRPARFIVISTQIIEQSMDIDFDVMISDIAPMDLLIQRAGRLHRHVRAPHERPLAFVTPQLFISGCDEPTKDHVPDIATGIWRVYGKSILLRTLHTLLLHGDVVHSPDDVSALVTATYEPSFPFLQQWRDRGEEEDIKAKKQELDKQQRAEAFLLPGPEKSAINLKNQPVLQANEERRGQAQVRDIDSSLEVVLIQRTNSTFTMLPFSPRFAGQEINFGHDLDASVSKTLAQSTVALPSWVMPSDPTNSLLDELECNVLTLEQVDVLHRNRWLRDQLFLPLDENLQFNTELFSISYDQLTGLKVARNAS